MLYIYVCTSSGGLKPERSAQNYHPANVFTFADDKHPRAVRPEEGFGNVSAGHLGEALALLQRTFSSGIAEGPIRRGRYFFSRRAAQSLPSHHRRHSSRQSPPVVKLP